MKNLFNQLLLPPPAGAPLSHRRRELIELSLNGIIGGGWHACLGLNWLRSRWCCNCCSCSTRWAESVSALMMCRSSFHGPWFYFISFISPGHSTAAIKLAAALISWAVAEHCDGRIAAFPPLWVREEERKGEIFSLNGQTSGGAWMLGAALLNKGP